jgi:RHS repeat-associated protein
MDEQMYFGVSEVDGLTSLFADSQFALSNSSLDEENIPTDLSIYPALRLAEARLRRFALDPLFAAKMQQAFGKGFDFVRLTALQQAWSVGNFSLIPTIKILSATDIGNANAAFVALTNTIYISQAFLERSSKNPDDVADALIEEIGHSVDQYLNNSDSPGDEGAIFLALVSGQVLTDEQLQQLYQDNDHGSIQIAGQMVAAEFQNFVGDAGDNTIVGTASDDLIQGLDGNDSLYGLDGSDTLDGGAGDDYLDPGSGADQIIGGTGNDLVHLDYRAATTGITINYSTATGTGADGKTITEVERVQFEGSNGDDVVDVSFTNTSSNNLHGNEGNDTLIGGSNTDYIYGDAGNDTLEGGAGDDFLEGGTGTNAIKGGDGNDTIFSINAGDNIDGGAGNDFLTLDDSAETTGVTISFSGGVGTTSAGGTIQNIEQFIFTGGSGNDDVDASATSFTNISSNPFFGGNQLSGGAGDDTLLGGSGNDNLSGNEGNDTLDGGAGNDNLDGGTGTNTVNGGDGNDTIFSINAGDNVDGGAGNDFLTLDGSGQTTGVMISFSGGVGTTSVGGTIQNIEQFVFSGGSGNDNIDASATSFTNISGNPFLGGNQLSGGAGDDTLLGGSGNDNLSGNEGNDTLDGGAGDDNLDGGVGTNTVHGGSGNDTIRSINAADNIDGGVGNDFLTLDDSAETTGVTISFSGGVGMTSAGGTIQNIEQFVFTGGSGNDSVDVSSTSFTNISSSPFLGGNQLSGGAGDDTLLGSSGNDNLFGNEGNDTLEGGAGDDILEGGTGTNTINGGDGNDTIFSINAGDNIDGGASNDFLTLDDSAETTGVTISFSGGVGTTSAGGTIQNIEQFVFTGGSGNDSVDASATSFTNISSNPFLGGNQLSGGAGDDTLRGGSGNDNLSGDDGNDTLSCVDQIGLTPGLGEKDILTGGAGADRFLLGDINRVYYDNLDTTTSGDNDYAIITDFNPAEDVIQLRGSVTDYRLEPRAVRNRTDQYLYLDKPGNEPDELVAILQNTLNLTINSSAFTFIQPNSELQFSTANFSVNENGTQASVVINRSGSSQGSVSATLTFIDSSATAPQDYDNTPIIVDFADGETSKIVAIPIVNDSLIEGNENLILSLSNPIGGANLGAQNTTTLTIIDDDVLIPDYAGNSLSNAQDISVLNGTQSFNDYVDAVNEDDFYRFELLNDSAFSLNLDGLTADANVELLNSAGQVIGTASNAGALAETLNDTLNAGIYYIRIFPKSGQTNYNLSVTATPIQAPLQITSVTPDSGSNQGQVTLTIKGNNFTNDAQVSLTDPSNIIRNATSVIYKDDKTLTATFDLAGLSGGAYDVSVSEAAGIATQNDIFNVNSTTLGKLDVSLNVTGLLRPWNIGEIVVNYTNTGNTDIPAPLLSIDLLADVSVSSSTFISNPRDFTGGVVAAGSGGGGGISGGGGVITLQAKPKVVDTISFWAGGDNNDSSTLSPGETGTYKTYFLQLSSFASSGGGGGTGGVSFSLKQVEMDNTLIDWSAIKDSSRPSFIPVDAWDVIYSNLTAAFGSTSGSYQKALSENSSYLTQIGTPTSDVSKLIAFEVQQANNSLGAGVLASGVDAVGSTPGGLSLVFERQYLQGISSRFSVTDLGRGWSHNWDVEATTDLTTDNVTIRSGSTYRVFEKRADGTYRAQDGDYGTLKLQAGVYRLEEKGGLVEVFNSSGRLGYVEDTDGNRITLGYVNNRLTDLTHSNGDKLTLSYNAQDRIDQLTDQAGRVTSYGYDPTGQNLLSVTGPDGTTSYAYEPSNAGQKAYALSQVTAPDDTKTQFDYDGLGRLTQKSLFGGTESLTYTYDSTGGVTVDDSSGVRTKLFFNDKGQIARTQDGLGRSTQFSYDGAGNLTRVTAPGNSISTFTYDRLGNVLSSTNALGQRTNFTYEPKYNNLATVRDPKGNSLSYTYNNQGNVAGIAYVDGSTEAFSYDAVGNLTVSVNRRGQKIDYTYDNRGLLLSKKYPDGTTASYTYDNRGNLLSAVDSDSSVSYTYDSADRLTRVDQDRGRFVEYTYDAGGRRTKMVDQTGATVHYLYDMVGRLVQLTDAGNQNIITYTYDAAGRLSREDNGNGTYTKYAYDVAGQVTSIINYTASNVENSKYEYEYDNLGRRVSMTTLEGKTSYGYDAIGQLTTVLLPDGRKLEYAYDAAGNRTSVKNNGVTTNYNTNNLNEYSQVGAATYSYDLDGNLVSTTDGKTYTYDAENRLIKVVTSNGTWTYEYDALGNRIASIKDGERTEYLLDPTGLGDVVGEYGSTGNLVANYTYGLGLVSRVDGSNASSYYDTDAIGSVVGLSDTTGSYVDKYSYLPFGEDLTKVETVSNPFEYVGQFGVMDEGNGLDFMRARYYDSNLGRFIAVDPLGINGGTVNLYSYARNTPQNVIDPQGTNPLVFGFIGGILNFGAYLVNSQINNTSFHGIDAFQAFTEGFVVGAFAPLEAGLIAKTALTGLAGVVAKGIGEYSKYSSSKEYGEKYKFDSEKFILDSALGFIPTPGSFKNLFKDFLDQFYSLIAKEGAQQLVDSLFQLLLSNLISLSEEFANFVSSIDPNDIIGPGGYGTEHYLNPNQTFPYAIRFENQPSATAPAVFVTVTQKLDADLDLNTFELGDFGFGNIYIDVPDGLKAYSTRLDLTSTTGYYVDFNASLDTTTGIVTWKLTTIDPATGGLPTDPTAGFLPPDDDTHRGEGFVNYTIKPKANLTTGTTIDAEAQVIFDTNAPINTPVWTNTVDVDLPTSTVTALPATSTPDFTVSWSGSDTGSGITTYDIYVSVNGGQYTPWQSNTTVTSATYTGQAGSTYRFYSIAKDNIGNTESAPAVADAEIAIVNANNPPIAEANKTLTLAEDTAVALNIQAPTDPDGNPLSITISILPDPTKGEIRLANGNPITLNQNLTLTELTGLNFVPVANANGSAGAFSYSVSDGQGGTATQTVTLDITSVNDAPIGSPTAILVAGAEDAPYTISGLDLLTGFSDVDGDPLSVANLSATNGSLVNNNNGTYAFTPNANYNGPVTLNYNVIDGNGGSIAAAQSFNLAAVNDAPTLSNISKTGTANTVISFAATDFTSVFSDIDGDSLTKIQITALPTNGILKLSGIDVGINQEITNANLGNLTFTPNANYNGPSSFGWNGFDGTTYAVTGASVNLTINSATHLIQGTPGPDSLMGTDFADIIDGKAGNDNITGKKGDDTLIGGGDRDTFVFNLGDGTDTITDFGGVGPGNYPSAAIIPEVDTLQFQGAGLTARNLLLTQNGSNLEVTFEGISGNKVILQNFDLQNIDNHPGSRRNAVIGNILFDGQTAITDSYDVFDANSTQKGLFRRNTTTFLNDLNNTVIGFDNSDDVINGQGGNDLLNGKGGNDILRGGAGNDTLFGGAGNDILRGGTGNDTLGGGTGNDLFVLTSGDGTDTIKDFNRSLDKIGLANGLSFGQLTITQGVGSNTHNTLITDSSNNELLAILNGVQANTLTSGMFIPI